MTDDETLTLRVTVICGERCADDYVVVWRGLTIGRIMRATGTPADRPGWTWNCYLGGRPTRSGENGTGTGFADCKRQFREVWERMRATLTDQDHRHGPGLCRANGAMQKNGLRKISLTKLRAIAAAPSPLVRSRVICARPASGQKRLFFRVLIHRNANDPEPAKLRPLQMNERSC